mmetsp:Transcript_99050/g.264767  ORF Transcript_99050/g.264767 Transcript_99050/m.264767 type:complete len:202 (-) Transcript_99050:1264-1869(-)
MFAFSLNPSTHSHPSPGNAKFMRHRSSRVISFFGPASQQPPKTHRCPPITQHCEAIRPRGAFLPRSSLLISDKALTPPYFGAARSGIFSKSGDRGGSSNSGLGHSLVQVQVLGSRTNTSAWKTFSSVSLSGEWMSVTPPKKRRRPSLSPQCAIPERAPGPCPCVSILVHLRSGMSRRHKSDSTSRRKLPPPRALEALRVPP